MPTTREQLQDWLAEPEGSHFEFKEARRSYHFGKLLEYCVALANEGGGKIIFGVTDRRPRRIVGTAAFAEPGRTESGLHERLTHRIPVEELHTNEGRVLVVHVPARLPGTAWQIGGRYLKRAGDRMATMSDGGITYAALILFGTRAALGRLLAQAELVFEYRSSSASGPAADREEFREGFFLWHDAIWNKINLRNDRQSYQDGLFRIELLTFDEISVREALLNAVAHRDYRLGGSVFVRQYPRRLEIVSPGGFPPGVTPENILDQQNPRNRRLAESLAKCGMIERSGQGMNLMFESAIRQGKALPDFSGTSDYEVSLSLHGMVTSPALVRFIERLGEEKTKAFSTYDFLVLDYLHRDQILPDHLKACLPGLIFAGAVESIGRGRGARFILARGVYAALGSRGVYTRKKGLDRDTNKALLLQHIRDNVSTGARMQELRQVLPALRRSQIQVLLRELRRDGEVHNVGMTRGARWFPGRIPENCNYDD